ncbi:MULTISPECIES: hypothetical protein [unclassified Brenneria]|uniref:hypothetical protein n=1 Tax=unclassified Brenneria TaxID=2634434 RepID=UPI0029C2956D|nr:MULTISPECIES: hypothetical protein [unclassified Brenneria]MDX5628410.1 hypothetical protein [Brenneria sp. L3-3Z]MDX5695407.1 hypothetical protein [Brenneria sp. L4-2C]
MRKMNRTGCAICLAALLAATTPDVGAATYQEILRLAEAYPPGSVVVCRSDLPGDGKMRLPTTQITRGKVIARRNNLTDFDAVVTWRPKGENGKELTLTFRATERTERTGRYTRIDTDSMAVSQVGAPPAEEKIILDGFRSRSDGTEKFSPYTNIEITVFPSYIIRNQGETPAYCHKELHKNE